MALLLKFIGHKLSKVAICQIDPKARSFAEGAHRNGPACSTSLDPSRPWETIQVPIAFLAGKVRMLSIINYQKVRFTIGFPI
jgi:hypothetical protein